MLRLAAETFGRCRRRSRLCSPRLAGVHTDFKARFATVLAS